MDKKSVIEVISSFKKAIEAKGIKIEKLILFGSYATGDYKETSDIDIIVISNDFKDKDYWQRIDILSSAIYDVFAPIEAVAMTSLEWENKESMIVEYAKNGKVID